MSVTLEGRSGHGQTTSLSSVFFSAAVGGFYYWGKRVYVSSDGPLLWDTTSQLWYDRRASGKRVTAGKYILNRVFARALTTDSVNTELTRMILQRVAPALVI